MANERALEPVGTVLNIGSASFCLKSIAGVGFDGGEPIDVTCLGNTQWVTKQPQTLVDIPDITFTAQYDPAASNPSAEINKNQQIDLTFNDSTNIKFWGYLRSLSPAEKGKGEEWTQTGTVVVTNITGAGVEEGPSYSAP